MSAADYEVLELIGRGSFGHIRKVRRRNDGLILVRKEISYHRMSTKEKEQLTAEFGILSQLKHPNIVQYYHRDHIKADSTLHLYMEYCGNGDLSNVIRKCKAEGTRVTENLVWSIFTQIVLALYRCHNGADPPEMGDGWSAAGVKSPALGDKKPIRILHRDLKPENVFLGQDNDVKLGDFGLSKMLGPEQHLTNTYVGTPYYMSPEIVSDLAYTHKSDIWSLGCIIYELCMLSPPFNAKTQWALIQKIKDGDYVDIPSQYSQRLRETIRMCLNTKPSRRPDTSELLVMEPFILARKELAVVHLNRGLKVREETLKIREQRLLLQEEELRKAFEERSIQLHQEIDSDLRQKWEVKAELEIRKRVEIEVQARLQTPEVHAHIANEVERRIQELDLVPRRMRSMSPSDISGSSGHSSYPDSPPRRPNFAAITLPPPDSPVDVTMGSPMAISTPGVQRSITSEDLPRMPLQMLTNSLLRPASVPGALPPTTPCRTNGTHSMGSMELEDHDEDPAPLEEAKPKRSAFATGSPLRAATRRSGLQRAGTTGLLWGNNERTQGFGMGGRGESMDDVATVNPRTQTRSRVSLVEIAKMNQRKSAVGPAPNWERDSEDAPSPFVKRRGGQNYYGR